MMFEERPWGSYTILNSGVSYQVKKLVISPGKRISMQSHKFRAEHWFVVSGEGVAELNDDIITVLPGDSVDVSIGVKHRVTNRGEGDLVLIEVQTGTSFSEEDIIRYEDDYGRVAQK
jgi:mannose-6-phosphate isomerase-like protein (cupin superfamily)